MKSHLLIHLNQWLTRHFRRGVGIDLPHLHDSHTSLCFSCQRSLVFWLRRSAVWWCSWLSSRDWWRARQQPPPWNQRSQTSNCFLSAQRRSSVCWTLTRMALSRKKRWKFFTQTIDLMKAWWLGLNLLGIFFQIVSHSRSQDGTWLNPEKLRQILTGLEANPAGQCSCGFHQLCWKRI